MKRTVLIALALVFALPTVALAEGERERAEAAWFRAYWLETGRRDMKAAKKAYEETLREGEVFPEIAIRAYLGLARTGDALGEDGAEEYLDAAVQHYERVSGGLDEAVAGALKDEIDETAAAIRPGESRRDLGEEIHYQIRTMKNAWGTPVGVQAKQRLVLYGEKAVPLLASELDDTDPQHVRNVADVLVSIATDSAAAALAEALANPEVLYGEQIVGAARISNREPILRFLLGLFDHENEEYRQVAARANWDGELGFRAALAMLSDESAWIRDRGVSVWKTVDAEDVPPRFATDLFEMLDSDVTEVREQAVAISVEMGGEAATRAIWKALADDAWKVIWRGADALVDGDAPFRQEFIEPAVTAATTFFQTGELSVGYGLALANSLVENVPAERMNDLLPVVRAAAERGSSTFRGLVGVLKRRSDKPASFVRDAYRLLGEEWQRAEWLGAFSNLLGEEAFPIAREALTSRDARLRRWAAETLLEDLPPEEWPELDPLLTDSDASVRGAALSALIRRDGADAIPRVAAVVVEHDSNAEYAFRVAARELDAGAYRKLFDAVWDDPRAAVAGFKMGGDLVSDEQVLAALGTRSSFLANYAAPLAARRHLLEAWPLLLEIETASAKHALESIRGYYLGLKEYRSFLEKMESDAYEKAKRLAGSNDAAERTAAAMAFGALGDRQAIGQLLDLVRDPEPTVRDAAMRALERLSSVPTDED